MITASTVFVLGAGVSAPFGFPIGSQMRNAICYGGYQPLASGYVHTLPPDEMADIVAQAMGEGYAASIATDFINAYSDSDLYSVDAWLEANLTKKDMLKAGKAAISVVIATAEAAAMKTPRPESDWFAWLWNKIWTRNIDDIFKNDVWFLTFNYDRLFEWKLMRQIRNTYRWASIRQCEAVLSFFLDRIVHVHGVLGGTKQDYEDEFGKGAVGNLMQASPQQLIGRKESYAKVIKRLSATIDIVCETPQEEKVLAKAKEIIGKQGKRVIFLGFGFDERNVRKLELEEFLRPIFYHSNKDEDRNIEGARIIGTAIGLEPAERGMVEAMFGGKIALSTKGKDAVDFCRSYLKTVPSL